MPPLKSRRGCVQCKKRKIKCDETHPLCGNCVKHRKPCSYIHPPPPERLPDVTPTPSSASLSPLTLESPAVIQTAADHKRELELLLQYSTVTYQTMSARTQVQQIYQTVTPQLALSYDFLLHSIFALSALHLAYERPEQAEFYILLGAKYNNLALKSFVPAPPLVTQSNCEALFAFSSFMVLYAFALSALPSKHSTDGDVIPEGLAAAKSWVNLMRGAHFILSTSWPWIQEGRFGPVTKGLDDLPSYLPADIAARLNALESLWEVDSDNNAEIQEACRAAIAKLRICFGRLEHCHPNTCEVEIALTWPVSVPQLYVSMLSDFKAPALVIFAYYCLALNRLRSYWWIGNGPHRTILTIHTHLGPVWSRWMDWPSSMVRASRDGAIEHRGEL